MPSWRLIACVLLPFAGGYYLSYLFRTINALIAGDLTREFGLSAADLGLLTSVYFLVFAAVQLPFGVLLDRYGPRLLQGVLLLIAAVGALAFALADGLTGLVIGRALISVGVAIALLAGLKAVVLWFPPDRLAIANGWLVMLGALGAVTATTPADVVVQSVGWRGLFALLAALAAVLALLVLILVPQWTADRPANKSSHSVTLSAILQDARFWRIAPLSATSIATAWSLQGLWAAPWLSDVAALQRSAVVQHLSVMALVVCLAALLLGFAADRLRRSGRSIDGLLAGVLGLSMVAQLALMLDWPISTHIVWSLIAAAGAATVLSFAILADYFPKEASGRANSALSLLHVGAAFVLQCGVGLIVEQWPQTAGKYPVQAYQAALGVALVPQLASLGWFIAAPLARQVQWTQPASASIVLSPRAASSTAYALALVAWTRQAAQARQQAASWRLAAAASVILCAALAGTLLMTVSRSAVALHFIELAHADRDLIGPRTEVAMSRWQQGGAHLALADLWLPRPPDEVVAGPARELGATGQTALEDTTVMAIVAVEQKAPEEFMAAKVPPYADSENATEIARISALEQPQAAFRQHRSAHQLRRVRRPVPERSHGAILRPAKRAHSRERPLRHGQAHARVPGRDALAGEGRNRQAHRARGTVVSHARTSARHVQVLRSFCGVDSCADRRKHTQTDAATLRDHRRAAVGQPKIRQNVGTRHVAGFPLRHGCKKPMRTSGGSRGPRQVCVSRDPLLSLVTEVGGWLLSTLSQLANPAEVEVAEHSRR
jgi:MFS family permease